MQIITARHAHNKRKDIYENFKTHFSSVFVGNSSHSLPRAAGATTAARIAGATIAPPVIGGARVKEDFYETDL